VGAGPAGASAAIQLANLDPDLSDHILLLDKVKFPRPKLCAGGVTNSAKMLLEQLELTINARSVPVHTSRFVLPNGTLSLEHESHFRIFTREEFDYDLFRAAAERGIVTQDGEELDTVTIEHNGVTVRTKKNEYRAKLIIGADGANSKVRRLLKLSRTSRMMVAIETYSPLIEVTIPSFAVHTAIFDFTIQSQGLPGYCWAFPAINNGGSMVSLGIIQSSFNRTEKSSVKSTFESWLRRTVPSGCCSSFLARPALQYAPRAACGGYRAILVGDAAGIDPLFGEGITSALAQGMLAAESTWIALRTNDFAFSDYERCIRSSMVGEMMRRRRMVARRFYGKRTTPRQLLKVSSLLDWITPLNVQNERAETTWTPIS